MTPADRRIAELLDKWLTSIDLHMKYAALDDAAYFEVQPWPKHDRPTRWVLEVAHQKLQDLKAQCVARQSMGDGKFAEALEAMAFLANLVGLQHIERFIPLADPAKERTVDAATTAAETPLAAPSVPPATAGDEATREMPRLKPSPAKTPAPAGPEAARGAKAAPVRSEGAKPAPRPAAPPKAATPQGPKPAAVTAEVKAKVIADAVRLTKWGKPWHELAELISRIADRPAVGEIRKILRANRQEIEAKAKETPAKTTRSR